MMKTKSQITQFVQFMLLLLALVTNCIASSYAFTFGAASVKEQAATANDGQTDPTDKQGTEQEQLLMLPAYEALMPVLKAPITPVLLCIEEIALVLEVAHPRPTDHVRTSTTYHKVLFRRIISPNAP